MDQYAVVPQGKQRVSGLTLSCKEGWAAPRCPIWRGEKGRGMCHTETPLGVNADYQDVKKEGTH